MPAQTTETHTTLTPDTPVRYLKGVGPKTAERFEKLGIVTLADLLCHYPRRYMDFSKPYSIAEAPCDTECVVKAEVFAKPGGRILPGGRRMERITAGDDVSSLEITWFNNPYATQKLELGQEYYFEGIVTGGMLRRQMVNPQVLTAAQITSAPFEAVYPQTEGLSSTVIAKCIRQLLPHAELLPDPLPEEMLKKYRLLSKAEAVRAIHCPESEEAAFAARRRLIYEELLILQLGIGRMKNRGSAATGAPMQLLDPQPFWDALPFSPTGAQRRAVEEILTDMSGETSMNRLLQGDVGSGKTLVAAAAIWACIRAGYQAALLAPTEILASQHAENLNRLLSPFGMRVALLTGGMKAAARRTTLAAYVSVMPSVSDAATLEEVTDYTTANVTGVVKAPDGGIAIKAEEKGFDGGILTVIMGFDANGAETGIWVDASTQTKGIGSNVSTDDFLAQFNGMDGTKNIVMNQDFDAYSGATISSTALFAAINDCINCFNELA